MQTAFSRWVQNRWDRGPAAFELKRVEGQSLALSLVKDHQINALLQVTDKGNYHKIPDGGFSQSPYDCYFLKGEAFLVVSYGKKLHGFYLIPASVIKKLKDIGVVSLTEKAAQEFGQYYEIPKK